MSLKADILNVLEKNTGTYLSGQNLADSFGVSRNSVWKAINQIKNDGYIIDSIPNKGYCLSCKSDVLSAEKIYGLLSDKAKILNIFCYETIDSTNNEAKRMIADGIKEPALIIANEQTNGRGRLGRSFYSPKSTGAYMSFIFHPDLELSDAVSVTTATSVAVVCAIEKLTNIKPQIKWVNDIYIGTKKVCGILTEAVTSFEVGSAHSIVVGIGINTTTERFPSDIESIATSLNLSNLSRNALIAAVADEMVNICSDLSDKSYIKSYREHSLIIGKNIDFYKNNVKYSGTAVDIDDKGGLIVKHKNGDTEILQSGEVTIRLTK